MIHVKDVLRTELTTAVCNMQGCVPASELLAAEHHLVRSQALLISTCKVLDKFIELKNYLD